MAFSLVRIVPDGYRVEICYSKCLKSKACIYYKYDAYNARCIVCLRPVSRFANPKVGSEVEEYNEIYPSVFARIGIEFNVSACDFLDYACATRWFGDSGRGCYNHLEIANNDIKSLQFCRGWFHFFGGFNITLNSHESHISRMYIS